MAEPNFHHERLDAYRLSIEDGDTNIGGEKCELELLKLFNMSSPLTNATFAERKATLERITKDLFYTKILF